tara:strand:- start:285 stop:494 length:210 start_codon:yes stop_codon:yes gene_type:complete
MKYRCLLSGDVIDYPILRLKYFRLNSDNWYYPKQVNEPDYRYKTRDFTLFALIDDDGRRGLVWFPVEAI